jgi:hypothetical protein
MTYAVIEKDGERQNVLEDSLGGYDGWTVVARGLPRPPEFCSGLVAGKWQVDTIAKAAAAKRVTALRVSPEDLIARLERLEKLAGVSNAAG